MAIRTRAALLVATAAVVSALPNHNAAADSWFYLDVTGPTPIADVGFFAESAHFVNNEGIIAGTWDQGSALANPRAFVGSQDLGFSDLLPEHDIGIPVKLTETGTVLTETHVVPTEGPVVVLAAIRTSARAADINGAGTVVGSWQSGGTTRAMVWSPASGSKDLGVVGGASARAKFINGAGTVAGERTSGTGRIRPFVWSEQGSRLVPPLGSSGDTTVVALNSRGAVAGTSRTNSGVDHAFYWDPDRGLTDLGSLGSGPSTAIAMNDRGQVIGATKLDSGEVIPFIWSDAGGMVGIGSFPGPVTTPTDINEHGQVIGTAPMSGGWVWDPIHGAVPLANGAAIGYAYPLAINDRGLIVGEAQFLLGERRAVTWTVPTQGTVLVGEDPTASIESQEVQAVANVIGDSEADLVTLAPDVGRVRIFETTTNGLGNPREFAVDPAAVEVDVGDFDDNGRPDLFVVEATNNRVRVYLQQPNGNLTAGPVTGSINNPVSSTVLDFDRDGRSDVIVATSTEVLSFRNLASPGFSLVDVEPVTFPIGSIEITRTTPSEVTQIVALGTTATFQPLRVEPSGALTSTFEAIGISGGGVLPTWAIGDVDGNGRDDVVAAVRTTAVRVVTMRASHDGPGFSPMSPGTEIALTGSNALALADLDRDTDLDLVVAHEEPVPGRSRLTVGLGWESSPFEGLTTVPIGGAVNAMGAADVNRDGNIDIVAATADGDIIVVRNATVPSIPVHWSAAEYARIQQLMTFYEMDYDELTKFGVYVAAFINGIDPSPTPTPITVDPPGTAQTQTITWHPDEIALLETVKHRWVLDDEGAHRWGYLLLSFIATLQGG